MSPQTKLPFESYTLDYSTPTDAALQARLEQIDADLRRQFGMTPEQTAAGVLDLRALRLAMIRPDQMEYAASVPKIAILLIENHAGDLRLAGHPAPR